MVFIIIHSSFPSCFTIRFAYIFSNNLLSIKYTLLGAVVNEIQIVYTYWGYVSSFNLRKFIVQIR